MATESGSWATLSNLRDKLRLDEDEDGLDAFARLQRRAAQVAGVAAPDDCSEATCATEDTKRRRMDTLRGIDVSKLQLQRG